MNRREFLKLMGITAAGMAAPKLIFDMGKNSHIYTPQYEAYKLYKIDDRFGVYQPDGSWFYGPGVAAVKMQLVDGKIVGMVAASAREDIPQGKLFYPGWRDYADKDPAIS